MTQLAQLKVPGYDQPIQPPNGIPNPATTSGASIIGYAITGLIAIGVIATVLFMLWGAILWITSQGDKQKIQKARGTIIYSIIGLVLIIFSVVILTIIGRILGAPLLINLL